MLVAPRNGAPNPPSHARAPPLVAPQGAALRQFRATRALPAVRQHERPRQELHLARAMSDVDIEALIDEAGAKAKTAHQGVLPDNVKVVWRGFGRGGRWEARGPVSTAYCANDQVEAYRQAWWMVWCDDEFHRRKEAAT